LYQKNWRNGRTSRGGTQPTTPLVKGTTGQKEKPRVRSSEKKGEKVERGKEVEKGEMRGVTRGGNR